MNVDCNWEVGVHICTCLPRLTTLLTAGAALVDEALDVAHVLLEEGSLQLEPEGNGTCVCYVQVTLLSLVNREHLPH